MTQLSAEILAQCFDAIDRGDTTLEECLARHPQHSEELMPILAMAIALRDDPSAGPRPLFRRTARQRLLSKLPPRTPDRRGLLGRAFWQTLPRRAAAWVAAVIVFIVILGSSGIVYAGTRTLPGDTLYPVKTTVEQARLWIARGEDDVQLCLQFAEYRIQEIRRLGTVGRFSDVSTAASRFGAQMRGADEALLELAEYEPELAATLALRAEQTRTEYRQELSGLLQTVPDAERPAIEDILALDDDLGPHHLLDDDKETQGAYPAGDNADSRQQEDDLRPSDDRSPLAEEPGDQDDKDSADKDASGDRDVAHDAEGHPEPREDTGSGSDSGDRGDEDDDEHKGDRETPPAQPGQEHPDADDSSHSTPEPGDQGHGAGSSDDDDGERHDPGDQDDSDEHGGSDSEHDGHQDDEHDGESDGHD